MISKAGDFWPWFVYIDGQTTMRMPVGTYAVSTSLDVAGEKRDRSGLAVLVDPETVLNRSADVVLDARTARRLQTEAPQRAEDRQRKVDFSIVDSFGIEFRSAYAVPATYDDLYVSPTDAMTQGQFLLTTRWRKGEPMLGLSAGGPFTFDTLVQPGSTLLDARTENLRAVYAGIGAARNYEKVDARGKVVVIIRSDEVSPQERAAAAAAAGAKALIVVNDGVGGLMEYVGESPIPIATVHRDAGKVLIALAKLSRKLTVTQSAYTDFDIRPDPRLPGPGPRPGTGVQAEPARPCQDRRPLPQCL